MLRLLQLMLTSMLVLGSAGSAVAVGTEASEFTASSGNTAAAMAILSIAAALMLTLLFRSAAGQFFRTRTARNSVRNVLSGHSSDILSDFIVPGAYGGLTRIDHAILTSGGIVCIQTKNCEGTVFGGANEPQWTNVDGIRRKSFLNPLIQNQGRARALQKIVPDLSVANLVVFTGGVHFSSQPEENVIHVRDLDRSIEKLKADPCTVKDSDTLWHNVKSAVLTDDASRKDFNAQLSFS